MVGRLSHDDLCIPADQSIYIPDSGDLHDIRSFGDLEGRIVDARSGIEYTQRELARMKRVAENLQLYSLVVLFIVQVAIFILGVGGVL